MNVTSPQKHAKAPLNGEYLTPQQVHELTQIPVKTVYRVFKGVGGYCKFGGSVRWRKEAFYEHLSVLEQRWAKAVSVRQDGKRASATGQGTQDKKRGAGRASKTGRSRKEDRHGLYEVVSSVP